MKKLILLAVAILVFQKWGAVVDFINPPPDYSLAHDEQVILYSTAWCGYCKKTRELLADNNVPYYEYDIEKSPEGMEQYKKLGGRGIPLLLINGAVVKGYNPTKILELIN